jgi:hypothetical protein
MALDLNFLNSLKLDLWGMDLEAVESMGRSEYRELYLTTARQGICKTHDGKDVYFYPDLFDYGFFTVSEWKISSTKDIIDITRVERIRWIKEFIGGNVANSQCWAIPVSRTATKRLYCSQSVGYAVWLNPRSDKETFKFRTAHPAEAGRIWDYTREVKGSKCIGRF